MANYISIVFEAISVFFEPKKAAIPHVEIDIGNTVKCLQSRTKYFERLVIENGSYAKEFELSTEILDIIGSGHNLIFRDLFNIVSTYNNNIQSDDFDGSGWHDFLIILSGVFSYYGYNLEWKTLNSKVKMIKVE